MDSSTLRSATNSRAAVRTPRRRGAALRILRNPLSLAGVLIIGGLIALAGLAPYIAPYDPIRTDIGSRLQPPSRTHLFGTDALGRDILSRILYGTRISLRIAILTALIATRYASRTGCG